MPCKDVKLVNIKRYLIEFKANLEAALKKDKRPKPRSDIEDAMIVVNIDVRCSWRIKKRDGQSRLSARQLSNGSNLYYITAIKDKPGHVCLCLWHWGYIFTS